MGTLKNFIGTLKDYMLIGKSGIRIKNNSGIAQIRVADDSGFTRMQGADPMNDDDFATKRYADSGGGGGEATDKYFYGFRTYSKRAGTNYRRYILSSPGLLRDDTNTANIHSDYEIEIYNVFLGANGGVNGLDTGASWAISTFYYLWAIGKSGHSVTGINTTYTFNKLIDSGASFSGVVNVGDAVYNVTDGTWTKVTAVDSDTQLSLYSNAFTTTGKEYIVGPQAALLVSLSSTSPTMPTGYSYKRRIGSVLTDTSGYFHAFYTVGQGATKIFMYYDPQYMNVLTAGTSTSFSPVSLSSYVPPTSEMALLNVYHLSGGGRGYIRESNFPGSSYTCQYVAASPGWGTGNRDKIRTDASQNIDYKTAASDNMDIEVAGYVEEL
jgi:hypothetical protein